MNTSFFISRRYVFAKKSHTAINIISLIAVIGVAIGTMAMVCTMSVFNGFQGLVAGLFTSFDPELMVTPTQGKTFSLDETEIQQLAHCSDVEVCTPILEGQALIVQDNKQVVVTLRGVADNFMEQNNMEDILYGEGSPVLHADVLEYGILGFQLAGQLGLGTSFPDPIQIYAPKKGERVNIANPISSFNHDELQSPGVIFMVHQAKYDLHYVISSLAFAQKLFSQPGMASGIEIKLARNGSRKAIERILGDRFVVQDRYEQQEDVFRIMTVEKLIAYMFLCFILIIACFNIIGGLSMLMIDKRRDMNTLRALGATDSIINNIFMYEGRIIIAIGAITGVAVGVLLCYLQQEYGFIRMGESEGSFIVDSYPVVVSPWDVIAILTTVIALGWVSIWFPVRYLAGNISTPD